MKRRGLSPRMIRLARWYSTGRKPPRTFTPAEIVARRRACESAQRYMAMPTSHGRVARDETRP